MRLEAGTARQDELAFILDAYRVAAKGEMCATVDDLLSDLRAGRVTFYVLRADGVPAACVGVQWGRRSALFTTFYRDPLVSDPARLMRDAKLLARRCMEDFRRMGVEHVAAVVETANDDAARLMRLYRRLLGLTPQGALLGASIDTVTDRLGEKVG